MALEEGDIVLCTVDRIMGTVVFVRIDSEEKNGSIILSEIAPGRIRNLREYVIPKKRIVCKVLRVTGDTIALSLRRVTLKEKKEALEVYAQEKSYNSILRSVLKEKTDEIIEKITKTEKLYDFLQRAKENPKELEELVNKEDSKKILNILQEQKKKNAIIKKIILLRTQEPNGIELIKEILKKPDNIEIKYLAAGKYSLKTENEDIKKGDNELKSFIEKVEKKAKELGVYFELKEK
jgi:translation initiation factor 2 alpha subunit (eIF-2alpha)